MRQSHVIDVGGTFAGAAIGTTEGFRFHPVRPELLNLGERSWGSLEELRHAAKHRLAATPPPPATSDRMQSAFDALLLASGARHPG